MKVDPKAQLTPAAAATRAQPFKQLLSEAKAELKKQPPAAKPVAPQVRVAQRAQAPVVRTTTTAKAAPQALVTARAHANLEAQRLGTVRSEATEHTRGLTQVRAERSQTYEERTEARVVELIVKELGPEPRPQEKKPEPTLQLIAGAAQPPQKVEAPTPEARAAQAVALIERIEVFVRSQRPGLCLTLNNSLGATVEIERIGPKEIALKLVGQRGPPSAEAVSRIRDELRARGLKVGALSVA